MFADYIVRRSSPPSLRLSLFVLNSTSGTRFLASCWSCERILKGLCRSCEIDFTLRRSKGCTQRQRDFFNGSPQHTLIVDDDVHAELRKKREVMNSTEELVHHKSCLYVSACHIVCVTGHVCVYATWFVADAMSVG